MYARLKKRLQNLMRRSRRTGALLGCSLAACGLAGAAVIAAAAAPAAAASQARISADSAAAAASQARISADSAAVAAIPTDITAELTVATSAVPAAVSVAQPVATSAVPAAVSVAPSIVTAAIAAAAPFQLDKDIVPENAQSGAAELAKNADCVVVGRFSEADRMVPTGKSAPQGRLVNFVQTFTVRKLIKGNAGGQVTVITTGIEPLPPPSQLEANERYPGAWATGPDYLLFLRKLEGSDEYAPLGMLQGVYPIQGGRTISIEGKGFSQLNGLPEPGLQNIINGLLGQE
ncbi:hypothetical protein [Paenibacillus herberti]|uniref:Uncharacterized protein n=1 Tax=Paenibacillus herberti TaxID=1619309 RepID=A0A229NUJ3_9BACL|nr:hypothetical protein [Paenibacillus herberti]OXM13494.1 hypothetical protein CGZ75_20865 [Paenibacillus herberti]